MSRSLVEAEYRSMAQTTYELQWLSYLLEEFEVKIKGPIILYCDNMAAIAIAKNPVFHKRIKHVEIDVHKVRELIKQKLLITQHVYSKKQVADMFTKGLSHS